MIAENCSSGLVFNCQSSARWPWFIISKTAADPETAPAARGLTLDGAGRAALERLRPLLTLPADALLQRLLDDDPDGGPIRWGSYPSLAGYLP